jgi:MOSC domain-containing protein YiiM
MAVFPLPVRIDALLRGHAVPFGPNGECSAIDKQIVNAPILLTRLGLEGDEQGDPTVHGGPDKALHHFPAEHYAVLAREVPAMPVAPGGFGENLSTTGLTEADVCLGDIFRIGEARVQLSQGRQPCWKLNVRFGHRAMARLIQQQGRTGWYYRVLEEGRVGPGDCLTLVEREWPQASLARILHVLYRDPLNTEEMRRLVDLPVMPSRWRDLLHRRLASGKVENMQPRLDTPERA